MRASKMRTFKREASLVAAFARGLRDEASPWGPLRVAYEFDYGGGSADIFAIGKDNGVVAFEAKLTKWRDALHQAYRTRCFATRAYVVVPSRTAAVAAQCEFEFLRRRVGLCTLDENGRITIVIECVEAAPLQGWLAERAMRAASKGKVVRCPQTKGSSKLPQTSAPLAA